MKTLQITLLLLLATIFNSCASEPSEDIRITIKNEWWITISPNGVLGLSSLTDSNPMAMVSTGENVVDYKTAKQKIKDGLKFTNQTPEAVAIALVDGSDKYLVTDDLLLGILQIAGKANQWQGAGLNSRLLELLDKRPLLKSKEMQNKALHPTDGAVEPEKPKE